MSRGSGHRGLLWTAVALTAVAAGCYRGSARTVSLADVQRDPGWTVVSDIQVIRQQSAHDCGPAALAMVLAHWGIPDASDEIRRSAAQPADHALSAAELRQFARGKGLQAFVISGAASDLKKEIAANRPVLVGLIQRYRGSKAYAHYAVIIGMDREGRRVLMLDPGHGAREDDLGAFDKEWKGSGRLALVVAPS